MKNIIIQYLIIILNILNAQSSYEILNLSIDARNLSLNNSASIYESLHLSNNPSSLSSRDDVKSYSYILLPANIHFLGFQNIKQYKKSSRATKLSYINYGQLIDSKTNNPTQAYDILIEYGYKKELYKIISIGISGGFLFSNIADYKSNLIYTNIGLRTRILNKKIGLGISFENIGYILKRYTSSNEVIPSLVRLSSYYELKHIPAIININYINNYNKNISDYLAAGVEFKLVNNLSLRLATSSNRKDFLTGDFTSDVISGISAGLGFSILDVNYDIGFKNLGSAGYIIGFSFIKNIN